MRAWASCLGSCLFLALAPLAADLYQHQWRPAAAPAGLSVPELLGGEVGNGFSRPRPGRDFRFPQDHASHPDYRTEWWYYTGNLGEFGYELTLFRQALVSPLESLEPRHSQWASPSAVLGHFAISDVRRGRFHHFERLSRSAIGLADCAVRPVKGERLAWVEDWSIRWLGESDFELQARDGGCALQLQLSSLKPPVLQGEQGYSRKADQPDQASNYYSLTRLATRGLLTTPEGEHQVAGLSWMDREWSTRPLGNDLVGWDWFALQTDNGQELMFYRLRNRQGQATRWSAGSWVEADGNVRHLKLEEVRIETTGEWTSPVDGARYPAGWQVSVPSLGLNVAVKPRMADQELTGLGRYWEGAVSFTGSASGTGYVELVGYAKAGLPKTHPSSLPGHRAE